MWPQESSVNPPCFCVLVSWGPYNIVETGAILKIINIYIYISFRVEPRLISTTLCFFVQCLVSTFPVSSTVPGEKDTVMNRR